MNILVTGAGGYIGRHLIPHLRVEGHAIIALYHTFPEGELLDPRGELLGLTTNIACDLLEDKLWRDLQDQYDTPDTVIHLAGLVDVALQPNPKGRDLSPIPGEQDIAALYRNNVLATANVLDYCLRAGVKHLIFASTQAVYGMGEGPLEQYAASKLASEEVLRIGARRGLTTVTILRLPGIYGGDRKNGAVWEMCKGALTAGQIQLNIGYPLPYTIMHIEDVIAAIAEVVQARSRSDMVGIAYMNVSDGEQTNLTIVANEVAALVRPGVDVVYPVVDQPICKVPQSDHSYLGQWKPIPRRERLVQVLEEVRRQSLS